MSAIVLVSVLILPIVYFLGLAPYSCELIASIGFGFGAIVALTLLFFPKMVVVYSSKSDKRLKSGKIAAASAERDLLAISNPTMTVGSAVSSSPRGPASLLFAEELLKGKSKEEKLIICQEQLAGWQTYLLSHQRSVMHSSSSAGQLSDDGDGMGGATGLGSKVGPKAAYRRTASSDSALNAGRISAHLEAVDEIVIPDTMPSVINIQDAIFVSSLPLTGFVDQKYADVKEDVQLFPYQDFASQRNSVEFECPNAEDVMAENI
jgi:hypothetical protein